jgi:hypothetical protein
VQLLGGTQSKDTCLTDAPEFFKGEGELPALAKPAAEVLLVERELMRADLCGLDRPLPMDVDDRHLRGDPRAGDVHAPTVLPEIAVRLRNAVQPMLREDAPETRRVGLAHIVDPDCERDGEALLESDGREECMLGAAGAAVLGKDQAEVGAVGVVAVRELMEIPGSAPIGAAADSHEGLRIRAAAGFDDSETSVWRPIAAT